MKEGMETGIFPIWEWKRVAANGCVLYRNTVSTYVANGNTQWRMET